MNAPLPGRIEEIKFRDGEWVEEGRAVLIIESMKMNIPLYAERSGKIFYLVEEDEFVFRGKKLFIIGD